MSGARNAANSRLLASFLTKIWGILTLFIRDAISCKGLYGQAITVIFLNTHWQSLWLPLHLSLDA